VSREMIKTVCNGCGINMRKDDIALEGRFALTLKAVDERSTYMKTTWHEIHLCKPCQKISMDAIRAANPS
jgi:hypothetical protein